MGTEWPKVRVEELQAQGKLLVEDGNHGEYRPLPHEFGSGATAFIRAADMDNGRVLFDSADRITDAALARIRKGLGKGGDILFSHKGTVGKLALVPFVAPPFVCSPQTTFWRVLDPRTFNRQFLYAFMRSDGFMEQWRARKGETDMADYVSLTAQRELRLPVPPIEEQVAIGRVLGGLDDKIELNHQINQTLDSMARAVFRSWFVDFEPVVNKVAARRPVGRDADTVALFPSAFEDSLLGSIPRGWGVSRIGDEVRVVGGSTPRTNEPRFWDGGRIHWATPKDLSVLADPVLLDTERRITAEGLEQISSGLLPAGTVLLSSRAPIGYLAISEVPTAVNQGLIAMVCSGRLPNHYVLQWVRETMDEITSRAGGTTFAEISRANFRPISVLVPDEPVLVAYAERVRPFYERVVSSVRESRALSALREALLPKLLSGEIRVREAEKVVGQAGA